MFCDVGKMLGAVRASICGLRHVSTQLGRAENVQRTNFASSKLPRDSLPGKKEKMRGKLSGAEKDDLRSLEKKLEKRLNTGYRPLPLNITNFPFASSLSTALATVPEARVPRHFLHSDGLGLRKFLGSNRGGIPKHL